LTYNASNVPKGANFDLTTQQFSWIPSSSQAGIYLVNFTVTDGSLTDYDEVTISVNNINQAPVLAAIGSKEVDEGNTISFTISATDPDQDPLRFIAHDLPIGATFDPELHTFTWTLDMNQAGIYMVNFTVNDGMITDYERVVITVTNVNRPPILEAIGPKVIPEGELLLFIINAIDLDQDVLTYMVTDPPTGSSFDVTTKTFTWTPEYTQSGSYNVTFTVSDGYSIDSEIVTITVGNINKAPVLATIGTKMVSEGESITFTITATDPDEEILTYSAIGLPTGAIFTPGTQSFSWTPTMTRLDPMTSPSPYLMDR
jgi:Putative Ig domain.